MLALQAGGVKPVSLCTPPRCAEPAVFDALHERLHISAAALEQRAAVLAAEAAGLLEHKDTPWEEKQE